MKPALREYYTEQELLHILAFDELPMHPTLHSTMFPIAIPKKLHKKFIEAINYGEIEPEEYEGPGLDIYEESLRLTAIFRAYGLYFDECHYYTSKHGRNRQPIKLYSIGEIRLFLNNNPDFDKPGIFFPEHLRKSKSKAKDIPPLQENKDDYAVIDELRTRISFLRDQNFELKLKVYEYRDFARCLDTQHPAHSKKLAMAFKLWKAIFGHIQSKAQLKAMPKLASLLDNWEKKNGDIASRQEIERIINPRFNKLRSRKR